jgi:hypothetical protein
MARNRWDKVEEGSLKAIEAVILTVKNASGPREHIVYASRLRSRIRRICGLETSDLSLIAAAKKVGLRTGVNVRGTLFIYA